MAPNIIFFRKTCKGDITLPDPFLDPEVYLHELPHYIDGEKSSQPTLNSRQ